jgi:hypothetical protein
MNQFQTSFVAEAASVFARIWQAGSLPHEPFETGSWEVGIREDD